MDEHTFPGPGHPAQPGHRTASDEAGSAPTVPGGPGHGYTVVLGDGTAEPVPGAVGYLQEGPLTTFYAVDHGRGPRFDAWATKLLSVRTDRIAAIRRGVATAA